MEKVIIAKIVNTLGIKGDLKLISYTDFPKQRFKKNHHVFVRYQGKDEEMVIANHYTKKGVEIVSFKNHQDINLVEKYKDCLVYDYKDPSLLGKDEYYVSDLVGCDVYDQGRYIGKISEVKLMAHHDVLVVEGEQKHMIPYIDTFVLKENIKKKKVDVKLIEGM